MNSLILQTMGIALNPHHRNPKAEPSCFCESWKNRKSFGAIQIFFKQTVDKYVLREVVRCNGKNKALMSSLR